MMARATVPPLSSWINLQQIRQNGWIKWIIPDRQTLLQEQNQGEGESGETDLTVTRADLPLPASAYKVFKDIDFFKFSIADRYDNKKNINYIWLNVKFKDINLDAYTDFSFPKDGDPGTNGTDYVAKVVTNPTTDRLYISSKNLVQLFNDQGVNVDKLEFQVYNNSVKTNLTAGYWSAPPKTVNGSAQDKAKGQKTYLTVDSPTGASTNVRFASGDSIKTKAAVKSDKPVNIVRGQYGSGDIKYFAEMPICTNYIKNGTYRIKIKPKTGYKYVVYSENGTSPDYDNTLPFEVIVEKLVDTYWQTGLETYTYTWDYVGNFNSGSADGNKYTISPKPTFDGSDLSSAIFCQVFLNGTEIGFIHVPVYMIINRYNNRALNSWDGNSIEIDKEGNGAILAPQMGAGKKQSDNSFTGVLMGQIDVNTADSKIGSDGDTGIMGYHQGERSIFLDAKTGNATFGKQGAGQIKITATSGQGTIQSGDYNTTDKKGMKIKFSSTGTGTEAGPYIKFGSGNFSVDKDGNIVAKGGGTIANWKIGNDALTSQDNRVYLRSSNYTTAYPYAIYSSGTFTVTPAGYLTSTSGKIAKWSIDANALTDGNVGLGEGKTIPAKTFNNQPSAITEARIWANNVFAVDKDGKVWANTGQIGPWAMTKDRLENGNVGLGNRVFDNSNPFTTGSITARFWGASGATADTLNFAVDNSGKLYSKAGKIGGWTINNTTLTGGNTVINSNGSLSNSGGGNGTWAINNDGSSTFTNINASGGKIGGCTITPNGIQNAGTDPTWSINNGGKATFGNVDITGGSITLGGTVITPASFNSGAYHTSGGSGGSGGTSYIDNNCGVMNGPVGNYNTLEKWGEAIVTKYIHAEIAKIDLVHALGISVDTSINVDPTTGKPTGVGARIGLTYGGLTLYDNTNLTVATSSGGVATGRTGTLTFSDGSYIQINKGIITFVGSGSSGSWSGD